MVINVGALKGRDYAFVQEDIHSVVEASKPYPVKVILETSSLNDDQKHRLHYLVRSMRGHRMAMHGHDHRGFERD